ncbi:MAG: SEL1-like repeat protein [Methylovirgula sp.]
MAREPDIKRLGDAYGFLSTNRLRAISELEHLANEGSVMSMLYLAQAYQNEPNFDPKKIQDWYRSAYERGSATGLSGLGAHFHQFGNHTEAEKIYKEGVSKNDGVSMYWLASLYVEDNRYDKSSEIKDLLEKSAALGLIRAKKDLSLSLIKGHYGKGNIHVKRNILLGVYLYFSSIIDAFREAYHNPSSPRLR